MLRLRRPRTCMSRALSRSRNRLRRKYTPECKQVPDSRIDSSGILPLGCRGFLYIYIESAFNEPLINSSLRRLQGEGETAKRSRNWPGPRRKIIQEQLSTHARIPLHTHPGYQAPHLLLFTLHFSLLTFHFSPFTFHLSLFTLHFSESPRKRRKSGADSVR